MRAGKGRPRSPFAAFLGHHGTQSRSPLAFFRQSQKMNSANFACTEFSEVCSPLLLVTLSVTIGRRSSGKVQDGITAVNGGEFKQI
jgi:hypothetical protein